MTQELVDKTTIKIFGETGFNRIKYLNDLEKRLPTYTYKFTSVEEYKDVLSTNFDEGSRIYWLELLERAHWASITTIYRTLGWISGTTNAYNENNYLLFCAGYRGYLESSADSFYSLANVPESFAKIFPQIKLTLQGKRPKDMIMYSDLEDYLIHFSYARSPQRVKKDKSEFSRDFPSSHYAETIRKYFDRIDTLKEKLHTCYSELCEVTHPAMSSVWMYVGESVDNFKTLQVMNKYDEQLTLDFCIRHKDLAENLLMIIFNLTIMTLKIINKFNLPELKTPYVDYLDFGHVQLWKDIELYLPKAKKPNPKIL